MEVIVIIRKIEQNNNNKLLITDYFANSKYFAQWL